MLVCPPVLLTTRKSEGTYITSEGAMNVAMLQSEPTAGWPVEDPYWKEPL